MSLWIGSFRLRGLTHVSMVVCAFLLLSLLTVIAAEGAGNDRREIVNAYKKLPLSFIKNEGQVDGKVKFYEKGSGHATFYSYEGIYLSLSTGRAKSVDDRNGSQDPGPGVQRSEVVRLVPLGANKGFEIVAEDKLKGKINYFMGSDRSKWKTNVPAYGSVVYKEIYKGIDMKFYGDNRRIEYDVVVKPGSDPAAVRIAYEGIEGLRVTSDGDMEISLKNGSILQKKPRVYQEIDGKRVEIEGKFRTEDRGAETAGHKFVYGFEIAHFNAAYPLIIDPVVDYSTYLGGSRFDLGYGIAVDSSGNAYVTGYTNSTDFPIQGGVQGFYGGGSYDAFVTAIDSTGALIYSTYLGGSGYDWGYGIAVDFSGNAYLTGFTNSIDFPTQGAIQLSFGGGNYDAFVAMLNAAGDTLVYSTYLGGSGDDRGYGIAVDSSGNAYVAGYTNSTDFPTSNPVQGTYGGGGDAFVTEINAAGNTLVYSTYLGGSSYDSSSGIAVDSSGNAYVTGRTGSTNFPTVNPVQGTYGGGGSDAFITEIDSTGGTLVYSTFLGGSGDDSGFGIAVDFSGDAYVVGDTNSTDFPTSNPLQGTYGGNGDAFVTEMNATGDALVYSTYLGGSGIDWGAGIAVDPFTGNAYVTGRTESTDFPTLRPTQAAYGGNGDAFVTELNSTGDALVFSTYLGGVSYDTGYGIALDFSGGIYVAGQTNSPDFPVQNPLQATLGGSADAFVVKIRELPQYTFTIVRDGTGTGSVDAGANCSLDWVGDTGTCTVDDGTEITLSGSASTGSTFDGWNNGAGSAAGCAGSANCTFNINSDSGVNATFTLKTYTVMANADGNGTGNVSSDVGGINYDYPAGNTGSTTPIDYGTKVVLTAAATNGWTAFWNDCATAGGVVAGNGTQTATCTFNSLGGDKTVTATFTLIQYTVTANASGTGSGAVSSDVGNINYSYPANSTGTTDPINLGTKVILTASASPNSSASWNNCATAGGVVAGNGTQTATCTFNSLNGNKTVAATFTLIQYTVTAKAKGTGTGSVSSNVGSINYNYPPTSTSVTTLIDKGTTVVLTASADPNSTASWSDCAAAGGVAAGNGTQTATCTFNTLDGSKIVTATFSPVVLVGTDLTGTFTYIKSYWGGKYAVGTLRLRNLGNKAATTFRVAFWLSNDGVSLNKLFRTIYLSGLGASATRDLTFAYYSPTSMTGQSVIAVIDSANQVVEVNEGNNRAVIGIP